MKIKFHDIRQDIKSEWASQCCPSIGELVDLGDDGHGTVRHVHWHFADDQGRPHPHRYVTILLGDPLPVPDTDT